jgi:cephalosporin hydroxylase
VRRTGPRADRHGRPATVGGTCARRAPRVRAELVTPGGYLVVEDTNINGHPVFDSFGPGPMEAVTKFLEASSAFVGDHSREKFLLTFNPSGWLRRV